MNLSEKIKALQQSIKNEIEDYEQTIRDNPEIAISDWYKHTFYESYKEMLLSDWSYSKLSEYIVTWLACQVQVLNYLYSLWFEYDLEMSLAWDDMINWITECYQDERRKEVKL